MQAIRAIRIGQRMSQNESQLQIVRASLIEFDAQLEPQIFDKDEGNVGLVLQYSSPQLRPQLSDYRSSMNPSVLSLFPLHYSSCNNNKSHTKLQTTRWMIWMPFRTGLTSISPHWI
jgi:hypothetical protein